MRVFIAGVMQGNKKEFGIHSQDYRLIISNIITEVIEQIEIIDPDRSDPDRLSYNDEQSADMFFKYCSIAGEVDILIAYVPEASMGSAIEMWNAYQSGIPVLTISPLCHNWVIKHLSTRIFKDLADFRTSFNKKLLHVILPSCIATEDMSSI